MITLSELSIDQFFPEKKKIVYERKMYSGEKNGVLVGKTANLWLYSRTFFFSQTVF